ncbi:ABC-type branched-chain amino acid transport system, substrate-binding protein [Desulfonatronum thiosulfatophilum]|uniref:ABC-type branched-chain amino acid transport system, substrate-binding protein n=1 Tax=Desulfonatronum thiosulfatophilum TaxID=617002 RepID=A0A1G6ED67_9BACT|nr:ABC transporter substrate-binding protein [Desulfonatronum thiosulfatophilum]SDB55429.1 ABC-type branched-chain amino acid transport system, substrate-binding protein [Desulfonatronum thiosulfatophilum]
MRISQYVLIWSLIGFLVLGCTQGVNDEPAPYDVPGVSDSEILIGSSLALSGHAGFLGTQSLHGALAYINHVNETGGVHGRKIRIIAYDDGYDPPRCLANTQKLIVEDQVFALFSYVGTPTTVKILPLIEQAQIPLLGIFSGANAFREPFNRYIVNIRASYYQETQEVVRHFVEDLGLTKIAVFYQYDAYGFDGLRGTELALRNYDLAPVARGSYTRGTLDIKEGLDAIAESEAEAVIMVGTYDACAKFIKQARARGFFPIFHNVSFVGSEELARILGRDGEGVIITQVVPPPDSLESQALLWGVVEYLERHQRAFPEDQPNLVALEGYINAKVLVEGLRRAGRNLNRAKFIDAIQSIKNYSLGIANTLSFSPTNHQGLERVYFTIIRNGRLVILTDWKKLRSQEGDPVGDVLEQDEEVVENQVVRDRP